ncbi:MAG: hypothetical protein HOP34_15805 [Methylococcaceae bacterium]|nr:hypothetical protein [Methylococcaceae bacterium]
MSLSPNANFNPVKFYQFAGKLYQSSLSTHNNEEEACRTIVGRSYYSAFLCAREFSGINNSSGSVHNDVIAYFKSRNTAISNNLIQLKDLRHKADYDLNETTQKRDAGESLRLAKKILTNLNYLP